MITAAGQGFAADAMDVSGNNIAIGGATYVGSATSVATATSVNGLAQGNIPVTANPNIANGTGGTAMTGTGGGMAINFNATALANGTSNLLVRAQALTPTTDLVRPAWSSTMPSVCRLGCSLRRRTAATPIPSWENTRPTSMRCRMTSPRCWPMPAT